MFTGIYIAAVGWGYYVAYGAALAAFLLLMAFKDLVDIFMVCGQWSCESRGPYSCCEHSMHGSRLGC